jgi:hypothetical protein
MKYVITAITLLTGFWIKSRYFTKIQTPNSPPTFNFSHEQLKEINDMFDKGELLDQNTQDKLNQDFANILGKEEYERLMKETLDLQNKLNNEVEDLLSSISNLGIDYTTILEVIDTIINFINHWF